MPEKRKLAGRKPWDSGIAVHCRGGRAACVEAADAAVYCRGDGLLYVDCAVCMMEEGKPVFKAMKNAAVWQKG